MLFFFELQSTTLRKTYTQSFEPHAISGALAEEMHKLDGQAEAAVADFLAGTWIPPPVSLSPLGNSSSGGSGARSSPDLGSARPSVSGSNLNLVVGTPPSAGNNTVDAFIRSYKELRFAFHSRAAKLEYIANVRLPA
jgi:hypothetical protein